MTEVCKVNTPAGELKFSVDTSAPAEISIVDYDPVLPDGMATNFQQAIVLRIEAGYTVNSLSVSVELPSQSEYEGPESSQFLEAHAWIIGKKVIYLGTEDGEALASRLGQSIGFDDSSVVTSVEDHSMKLAIPHYANEGGFSIHIAIAANDYPEEIADSCWFAVDVSHNRLLHLV